MIMNSTISGIRKQTVPSGSAFLPCRSAPNYRI